MKSLKLPSNGAFGTATFPESLSHRAPIESLKRFANERHQSPTLHASSKQKTRGIRAPPYETNLLLRWKCQHVCCLPCSRQNEAVIYLFSSDLFFFLHPHPPRQRPRHEQVESRVWGGSRSKWHAYQLAPPLPKCAPKEKKKKKMRETENEKEIEMCEMKGERARDRKMMQGFISSTMRLISWWEAVGVTTHLWMNRL